MSIMSKLKILISVLASLICVIVMLTYQIVWLSAVNSVEPVYKEVVVEIEETTEEETTEEETTVPPYTEDELFCLAATIYNEAGSDYCSNDTRRLVGYVVLNRVNDSRYPDTIREVLEQESQYGLFYYTGVKFFDRHTEPQEQHAVERAYRIAREVLEADAVPIPHTVVFQAEFEQGTSIYKYQDGIYFCHAKEVR